jgi:MFS family permease
MLSFLSHLRFLPKAGLWADRNYLRLWSAMGITSLGGQVTMLALPLTAAQMLNATPMQMGLLTGLELLPFALISLPAGVWIDRSRKLPIVIAGEIIFALALLSIAIAAWTGRLTMGWLYAVGFLVGCLHVICGSAAQVLLTQIVPRDKLVEAHSKNALVQSFAEVGGPSIAGLMIQLLTAPFALLVDAMAFVFSVMLLRGLKIKESSAAVNEGSWVTAIKEGLRFVWHTPALRLSAIVVGLWQVLHLTYHTVMILYTTRTLGFSAGTLGVLYTAFGVGSLLASSRGEALGKRFGIGPCISLSVLFTAMAWMMIALAPVGSPLAYACVAVGLGLFGFGASLLFIHFLALRQSVTPEHLLGRMTSTMRFLIIALAPLGSLMGGALAEVFGLRTAIAVAAGGAFALYFGARQLQALMAIRDLPSAYGEPAHGEMVAAA